jgi:hypothetical protein
VSRLRGRAGFALASIATALSVAWAGTDVIARLTDSASVGANTFTTAASWGCAAPGSATLIATADAWIDQASVNQNKGTDSNLFVMSKSPNANRRSLLRFSLPALSAGCTVTASTLRLLQRLTGLGPCHRRVPRLSALDRERGHVG